MKTINIVSEDASPNPEYLIKSIAEQGYSLETSLADLMDNSVSANADKIEVLIDMDNEPFTLFLADNGNGMSEESLVKNMQFPSTSFDSKRGDKDLGRFGLGLKTASFSQTRKFTVLSRKKGDKDYSGRTWDVGFLKDNGWKIIVNSKDEIKQFLSNYKRLSKEYLNKFESYEPNTIVIWSGLYKFETYLKKANRHDALKKEINEITTDYLALVFHRFMEKSNNPLRIRINNIQVKPFNPFPEEESDFRRIEPRQSEFNSDVIKIEGFVLPSRTIEETKRGLSKWTTKNRGLMDMEGIYIYRADRIILFGGWNGIIKKAPRLQLARLRVEVGNRVDHLLHLNVAKSQIVVPHELRLAFEHYIDELKIEAEREYYNRGIRRFSGHNARDHIQLFERSASNKGSILEINKNFPIIESLENSLNSDQKSQLSIIFRMINTRVNSIRHVHEEKDFLEIKEKDEISLDQIKKIIVQLKENGFSEEVIKNNMLSNLGYKFSSFPKEIKELLINS